MSAKQNEIILAFLVTETHFSVSIFFLLLLLPLLLVLVSQSDWIYVLLSIQGNHIIFECIVYIYTSFFILQQTKKQTKNY